MSLKKNIFANYVSQFAQILIGILAMPVYIKYMGAEAYGLVGFYIMLQAWMQLLDLGMTPTLIRETANSTKCWDGLRRGRKNNLNPTPPACPFDISRPG
ncbi:MAG: hypothetical protein D3922_16960, partial [Candidatus Electrothrix sp. AR1]|nr:hypothetical protein [Candidatus Electrothrix sp. AR1]